jgi:hypothetical protein
MIKMAYQVYALAYMDVQDPGRLRGLGLGLTGEGIVLNPRDGETEVTLINLADIVPRVFVSTEPAPEDAMPHQVRRWAEKLKAAIQQSQQEIRNVARLACAGKLIMDYASGWDHPDISRLASVAGEARELAKLLVHVGRSCGMPTGLLEQLVKTPLLVFDPQYGAALEPLADAIAATA